MAQIKFYTFPDQENTDLTSALQSLLNSEQENKILTTIAEKFFSGGKIIMPDGYGANLGMMASFSPDFAKNQQLDDPDNTCIMLFDVYNRSKKMLADKVQNPILNDVDVKGLELVIGRVMKIVKKAEDCDRRDSIMYGANEAKIEFGRSI